MLVFIALSLLLLMLSLLGSTNQIGILVVSLSLLEFNFVRGLLAGFGSLSVGTWASFYQAIHIFELGLIFTPLLLSSSLLFSRVTSFQSLASCFLRI